MKRVVFNMAVFILCLFSCTDKVGDVQTTDLGVHNMKIIPENPSSKDEISLVVYDDCTYNTLFKNKRTGKTIDIEKQFNSMMKWPCIRTNDTILLGKLSEGTYTVNYKLVDISTQVSDPVALLFTFNLLVSK